jgi:PAS domain S-box-containing protein
LSESDNLYRKAFESAADGVLIVDAGGVIVEASPAVERLFGYRCEDLVGSPIEVLVPEAGRTPHEAHRSRYMEAPYSRPMGAGLRLKGRHKDGRSIPVEISLSHLDCEGEDCVIAIVRDVTERERLRAFGVSALRASEEERKRIARELHDDTAQQLATLLLRLRVLERSGEGTDWHSRVEAIREGLSACADGVRRIARGLRPPDLERKGLVEAIRSHLYAVGFDSDVTLALDAEPIDTLLSAEAKLVLYRIVQEAVSNALRHARASRVDVQLRSSGDRIFVSIEDDGVGISVDAVDRRGPRGLGLVGMRERAAMLNGVVDIHGRPGKGTRVRVVIPSEQAREAASV